MLNTALRMMLDNAAKTWPIYERNVRLMSPTSRSDNDMYPGKIIDRDGESPEMPELRVHQVDSRVNELSGIIDLFETHGRGDLDAPALHDRIEPNGRRRGNNGRTVDVDVGLVDRAKDSGRQLR